MIEFRFMDKILQIQGSEDVSYEEMKGLAERLVVHPFFEPELDVLVDLRNVRNLNMDAVTMRQIVDTEKQMGYKRRVALVTSREEIYGLARMFQTMTEDLKSEFRVFDDYFNSLAWLVQNGQSQEVLKRKRKIQ